MGPTRPSAQMRPTRSVAACSRCRRGGGKPTDERRGRHCARLGDLGLALRLQHRCHLLGPIAAHRGVQPHRGLKQVVAASILLGAIVGALACSWLSDRFGRRGTLLMLAVLFIVGALWCADAPDVVVLSLGRLVLGFAVGRATQTAPMYVAELSPSAYRGRLVLCFRSPSGWASSPLTSSGSSTRSPGGADRNRVRTRRDHAVAVAAPPGKSALAGQAR